MSDELTISQEYIESRIFSIRGLQIMLDSDLAEMYHTETKYITRAIKRNPNRFPIDFAFQLNDEEWKNLKFQVGTSSSHGGRRTPPFVFTEQGVAMLSSVLQTDIAIKASVQIIRAFIQMRKFINDNLGLLQRVDGIERKLIEADQKFEKVFNALERKDSIPTQGIFFENQVFDAYELAAKIIRSAKKNIVLIDNYIDENTLTHLSKKTKKVNVLLLTKTTSKQLELDIKKVNEQYGNFELKAFSKSHDRFLIIDEQEVYHLGASLKDLGKKWFAFSKMDKNSVENILKEIGL
jgi:hypothetical protein